MAHGDEASDTASARLRDILQHFREHPVTGPVEGHTTTRTASAPLSLSTLDHVQASVSEVVQHTLNANPDAGPAPARADAVYDWCRQHTEHSDEAVQARRDTIEYRHYLEHAIRAGDVKVVRQHRCPECRTWGLMWSREMARALCTNTDCVDRDGFSRTWSLAKLAHEHIEHVNRKNIRHVSAT
jgi:hypothetical protein